MVLFDAKFLKHEPRKDSGTLNEILRHEQLRIRELVNLHNDLVTNYDVLGPGLMYQDNNGFSLDYTKKRIGFDVELNIKVEQIAIDRYLIFVKGDNLAKPSPTDVKFDEVGPTILQYSRELVGHE